MIVNTDDREAVREAHDARRVFRLAFVGMALMLALMTLAFGVWTLTLALVVVALPVAVWAILA